MPGKILEISVLLAAVMAVTLSVSVMGTIFPRPTWRIRGRRSVSAASWLRCCRSGMWAA